jgi:hypothetical protein
MAKRGRARDQVLVNGHGRRGGHIRIKRLYRRAFLGKLDKTTVHGISHVVVADRRAILDEKLGEYKRFGIDGRGIRPVRIDIEHLVRITKTVPGIFTALGHEIGAGGIVGIVQQSTACGSMNKLRVERREHAVRQGVGGIERGVDLIVYPFSEINNTGVILGHVLFIPWKIFIFFLLLLHQKKLFLV